MIFESARLYTRRFTIDDFEAFFLLNSDPDIVRFIREPKTREQAFEFLQEKLQYYIDEPDYGSWAIVEKETDAVTGVFMLRPSTTVGNSIELGYSLVPTCWGRGYATEIAAAGLDYAFSRLRLLSLVGVTHPENIASQNVLKKCGFTFSNDFNEDGKWLKLFGINSPLLVETSRLLIFPLNEPQLSEYIEAENKLEKQLMLANTDRIISPVVIEAVTRFTLPNMKMARKDLYLFFTFWLVIDKTSKIIVAELGFKGPPGAKGEIEIGYGTMPDWQGKGYMTEAVGGMINWAKHRSDVEYILAETDENNPASIRVVQKNNFQSIRRKGRMLWWKIQVDS